MDLLDNQMKRRIWWKFTCRSSAPSIHGFVVLTILIWRCFLKEILIKIHIQAIESAGVHIEFKLDSNDIVLSGTDRKIVDQFTEKLRTLRDERIRKAKERKCRVSTKMHGIIANGIDELLEKTGAILVLPQQKAKNFYLWLSDNKLENDLWI